MQNTGTSLLETFDALGIRLHVDLIRNAASVARSAQGPLLPDQASETCKVRRAAGATRMHACRADAEPRLAGQGGA